MLQFETEIIDSQPKSSLIRNSCESNTSSDSNENKKINFRTILIIINVLSFIIGLLIMKNFSYYLNTKYEFMHYKILLFYIILYSTGLCFTFILGFFISLLIIIFNSFIKLMRKINGKSFNKYEENSFNYLNENSNQEFLLPYTLAFFIIFTSILYSFAFPYSLYLFIVLRQNKTYLQLNEFKLLYSLIGMNALAGLILLYILYDKKFNKNDSNKEEDFDFEGSDIENCRNEIRRALNKVKE